MLAGIARLDQQLADIEGAEAFEGVNVAGDDGEIALSVTLEGLAHDAAASESRAASSSSDATTIFVRLSIRIVRIRPALISW